MRILVSLLLVLWAAPLLAEESFPVSSGPGSTPEVAAPTDSTAVFVYASEGKVWFRKYPNGMETPVGLPGTDIESAPAVDVFPDGSIVVVWLSDNGLEKQAMARFFDPTGNPTADPFPAAGDRAAEDLDVAALSTGGCVVTWAEFGPPGFANVKARVFGANSEPVSPVMGVSELQVVYNIHPRVAAASSGGFTIVWGTFLNPDAAARARTHTGIGNAWYDPWPVADNAAFPSVAIDQDNSWLMAWTSTEGKGEVRALREGFPEVIVGGSGTGTVALAMHSTGMGVVAWLEGDLGGPGVLRARILDTTGQPSGDIFTVAQWTRDMGGVPDVGVSPSGRIIFTWADFTTGKIMGTWWGGTLVPVAEQGWGSFKSAWR